MAPEEGPSNRASHRDLLGLVIAAIVLALIGSLIGAGSDLRSALASLAQGVSGALLLAALVIFLLRYFRSKSGAATNTGLGQSTRKRRGQSRTFKRE